MSFSALVAPPFVPGLSRPEQEPKMELLCKIDQIWFHVATSQNRSEQPPSRATARQDGVLGKSGIALAVG